MFEGFSNKRYARIADEIAADADAKLGQRFGLEFGSQVKDGIRKGEEAFISRFAAKIPLVKRSEQAYTSFLDTLRLSTFSKYRRIIDKADLTRAQRENAYKAASEWINVATGRGSLGKKFDEALPLLNVFMFAPKYAASRFNVLNPMMYARNAATAEGRIILKQQASELLQFAGVAATTLAIARAAGADVSLDPNSSDFLKIKVGRYRYDGLAGLQQVMRLAYRTGAAITSAVRGEKPKPGESALDIAGHFLRAKLAPVPSYFTDALLQRTYTGEKFRPVVGAAERMFPIQWADWLGAYMDEGWLGVGMATPGIVGFGVSAFDEPAITAALERAQPLYSEIIRLNRHIPELRRAKDETDDVFNARTRAFGGGLTQHGVNLVGSDEYKRADDATKDKALDLLQRRIRSVMTMQGEAWTLRPAILMDDVKTNAERRRELEQERQQRR